jgi:glycogen(starch) synthase
VSTRHVLLTTDVVGGVWDFTLTLAAELDARVTLLALGDPSAEQRQRAAAMGAELIAFPLKLEWMQEPELEVERTRRLVERLARDLKPDVIHANQFAAACADIDVPIVLTLHSDVLSWRKWTLGTLEVPEEWVPYVRLVREALARADRVVAVSQFLADEVADMYGCSRHIDVIHNGWPSLAGATPKEPITLLAGRAWDAAKNIALAGEAAQGIVYLAGDQTHPESGGKFAIPRSITCLGRLSRDELDVWLAKAAIYLSPAQYDPFGLLPLQAALAGCALLLSDIPSYRELWDGAASFFRSDDADDLRQCWRQLLDDDDRRAAHARLAQARALTQFAASKMAVEYSNLYATGKRSVAA